MLFSVNSNAWWGYPQPMPYGPYGYGGFGYGYGYGGYMPFIPSPSFNNSVTIIQQQPEVIYREAPPRIIYRDRYCDRNCFADQYSK